MSESTLHVAPVVVLGGMFAAAVLLCVQTASVLLALKGRRGGGAPTRPPVLASFLATGALLLVWLSTYVAELLAGSDAAAVAAHRLSYVSITGLPVAVFMLVSSALGRRAGTSRLLALLCIPVISLALNFTPPLTPWFWVPSDVSIWGPFRVVSTERGSWFWVHVLYSYTLLGGSLARLLVRYVRKGSRAWVETAAVAAALFLPWLLNSLHVVLDAGALDPTPTSAAVSGMLITWSLQRSRSLAMLDTPRARLLDDVPDAILVVDAERTLVDSNEAAARLLAPEVRARRPGGATGGVLEAILGRLERGESRFELSAVHPDRTRWYQVESRVLVDPLAPDASLVTLRDVTEATEARREIATLDRVDRSTGLLLRAPFRTAARDILRSREAAGALVLFDLDGFREVNQVLGYGGGDSVLQNAGLAFRKAHASWLRAGETRVGVAGRLGPDEFGLFVSGFETEADVFDLAREVCQACDVLAGSGEDEIRLTMSAGFSLSSRDGVDVESLWSAADMALHEAKREGGRSVKAFRPRFEARRGQARAIQRELGRAVSGGELRLVYQPRQDLQLDVPGFAEALLRWEHPVLGAVSPADFIPIAEDSGQIVEIGSWVLDEACRQLREWQDREVPIAGIAVNVSAVQLEDPLFFDFVAEVLRTYDLKPSDLELELTERIVLAQSEATSTVIRDLRAIGVSLSIDDFGTGYATLRSLVDGQFDGLKLDRSLVSEIDLDPGRMEIAGAILRMAWPLGLSVVAEGVEREEEVAVLRRLGCHSIQGYLYSRPLEPDAFVRFLHSRAG